MAESYNHTVKRRLDLSKATATASSSTVEIGYLDGNTVNITGTTNITSFGAARRAGVFIAVIFDGILTLSHSASLKLPGGADIITAAGDMAVFVAEEATVWKCVSYNRADVAPMSPITLSSAPVDGVKATVIIDMTNATSDLTYTAVDYGADGNNITVTHVDPSDNDQDLSVSVSGTDITVSLATDGGGSITSTAAEVKAAVNAHAEASLLVLCEDEGVGSGVVNAYAETALAGGVTVTSGGILNYAVSSDGTVFYIKVSEQVWKKIAFVSLLSDAPVSGAKATVTIDMTNPTSDLTYTAVDYGSDGNDITVTHTDPSGNDAELTITVDGTDIDISLATDGSGTITSTAAEVKAAVNAHAEAALLVVCEDEGVGSGVVNAVVETSLADGVDVTAGDVPSIHVKSDGTLMYVKVSAQVWKQVTLDALS